MKQKILMALGVMAAFVLLSLYAIHVTQANRSSLAQCSLEGDGTANDYYATGSLRYMSAGNSTTTLSCATGGTDQVDLLIALKASSTATNLGWWIEYSRNGVDWYQAGNAFDTGTATTSVQLAGNFTKYYMKYASSTPEENQGKADMAFTRVQIKDIGAPYMRVRFFLPVAGGAITATSSNGAFQVEALKKIQKL